MPPEGADILYDPTHDYLEVARAAAAVLGPPDRMPSGRHHHSGVHNAVFAMLSVTTVFSYMAVETYVDKALADAGVPAPPTGLAQKLRALCRAAQLPEIERQDPTLWAGLCSLAADARALMPGAPPFPGGLQAVASSLMARPEPLSYAAVAQAVLRRLRGGGHSPAPAWLEKNTLLDFRAFLAE